MYKIDLTKYITNFEGQNTDLQVGKAISSILLLSKTDPMRSYVMGQKFYTQKEIEISKADYEWIKSVITEKGPEAYTNIMVTGFLLILLADLKENQNE